MNPPAHPWIARLYRADATIVVLTPSAAGVTALHHTGRRRWIEQLGATMGWRAPAPQWRLLDTVQDADAAMAQAALPRPQLPQVLEANADGDHLLTLHLRVPLELTHFDHHFDRAPVVAGVLQAGWALQLAASRLGTPAQAHDMTALKFRQFLRPGDRISLQLHHLRDKAMLQFRYHEGAQVYSSGRLALAPADA